MKKDCSMSMGDCLFEKGVDSIFKMLDLDIVIHYTPYSPHLIVSLKFDKRRRFCIVDLPFYYSSAVLPARYLGYLDFNFADLEDE